MPVQHRMQSRRRIWWPVSVLLLACALRVAQLAAAQDIRSTRLYGSAIQFDVLNNMQVAEADVDYRFRAAKTGKIASFHWFDVYRKGGESGLDCDGYGCGTGGNVEICIYADDGTDQHLWGGKPLACTRDTSLRSGERIRGESFPVRPRVVAGKLYHLHWHNSDPHPDKNYISVDDVCVWHATTPRQPGIPDTDLAVLSGTKEVATETPIFQLEYADGSTQGQGYKEPWIYLPEEISGRSKVREILVVSGAERTVVSAAVRVNRASGLHALHITLATGSGTVLEEGDIASMAFPAGEKLTADARASQYALPMWGTYRFKSAHVLASGERYQLILSTAADTAFQTYGIQRGAAYGFSTGTYFADGHGEYSRDDGASWTGFRQSEQSVNHVDADLQFYFVLQ